MTSEDQSEAQELMAEPAIAETDLPLIGGETIMLPAQLDTGSVEGLMDEISARAGGPVCLDAADVTYVGGLAAQLLFAARRTWEGAGHAFEFANPSDAFVNGLARLGFEAQSLSEEG